MRAGELSPSEMKVVRFSHRPLCASGNLDDAEVEGWEDLRRYRQCGLQGFDVRLRTRLPLARTWIVAAMSLGDLLVDRTDSRRREAHHGHRWKLRCVQDVAERSHERLPQIGTGGIGADVDVDVRRHDPWRRRFR